MPGKQYSNACFTCWDPTDEEIDRFKAFIQERCSYGVFGHELPNEREQYEGKKVHLQGYLEFKKKMTMASIKAKLVNHMHIEERKGTSKQAAGYCKKGSHPSYPDGMEKWEVHENYFDNPNDEFLVEGFEFGTISRQGRRTDLKSAAAAVMAGDKTAEEIACMDPNTYHQFGRTLEKIEDIRLRKVSRSWMTTCLWIHGPTGTGKSHLAFKDYDPDTMYTYPYDKGWWDGYTGQSTVIFNEFRGNQHIPFDYLLKLVDKWPMQVRRRNRAPAPFLAKHIIITCPLHPKEAYALHTDGDDSINQLLRRIEIKELTEAWRGPFQA